MEHGGRKHSWMVFHSAVTITIIRFYHRPIIIAISEWLVAFLSANTFFCHLLTCFDNCHHRHPYIPIPIILDHMMTSPASLCFFGSRVPSSSGSKEGEKVAEQVVPPHFTLQSSSRYNLRNHNRVWHTFRCKLGYWWTIWRTFDTHLITHVFIGPKTRQLGKMQFSRKIPQVGQKSEFPNSSKKGAGSVFRPIEEIHGN